MMTKKLSKTCRFFFFFLNYWEDGLKLSALYKASDWAGIAFHIAMNTGQRISTKVATAYFLGISVPTNAQYVFQRH